MCRKRLIRYIAKVVGHVKSWHPSMGLRVLLYHSVGGTISSPTYGLSIAPEQFRDQMRWLRHESGCEIVSLEEGIQRLNEGNTTPLAAVTFDDGFRDILKIAAPILNSLHIPFTVFVTAAYLEQGERGEGLYLTHDELRTLSRLSGASIGAHGHSHRPLTRLPEQELCRELMDAKQAIEKVIDRPVTTLSYPHGAVNGLVRRVTRSAGYGLGATSLIGINRSAARRFMLRRTEITGDDGLEQFSRKIYGHYDWYRLKQRLYWPLPPA